MARATSSFVAARVVRRVRLFLIIFLFIGFRGGQPDGAPLWAIRGSHQPPDGAGVGPLVGAILGSRRPWVQGETPARGSPGLGGRAGPLSSAPGGLDLGSPGYGLAGPREVHQARAWWASGNVTAGPWGRRVADLIVRPVTRWSVWRRRVSGQ